MGTAREHEIRIVGIGLAALAVLAALVAIWAASTLSAQLRSDARSTPVTQGGSLGVLGHS